MAIDSNAEKLMGLDAKIKENLEDEVATMREIYLELIKGIRKIKSVLSQTAFDQIGQRDAEEILADAKEVMTSFNGELAQLDALDARFAKIKRHAQELKKIIETFKNTLNVYATSEKAVIDFDNSVIFLFKTKLARDFEQDADFNKRFENALG